MLKGMKSSLAIPLAIVAGGAIIAIAVYISMPKAPRGGSGGDPALVRPVDSNDHILGRPDAPIKIIEYSDFDCEYCKDFNETLHHIIANTGMSGKVAWVFREFPLIEIHPEALHAAEAAECAAQAGGNDAFWKFADELFARQPIDPSQFGSIAQSLGIPSADFATCYANASTTVTARIMADRQNAFAVGAQGTPYSLIVIEGKPPVVIESAYPYDVVKALVDKALRNVR